MNLHFFDVDLARSEDSLLLHFFFCPCEKKSNKCALRGLSHEDSQRMSLKKDKKSWSWLGWLGGSHTNRASAHSNDQLNDTILKHDPAALLTRKTVVESEIYKMTSKLRKSWSRYDGLTHEVCALR